MRRADTYLPRVAANKPYVYCDEVQYAWGGVVRRQILRVSYPTEPCSKEFATSNHDAGVVEERTRYYTAPPLPPLPLPFQASPVPSSMGGPVQVKRP